MAADKLVDSTQLDADLLSVANAIRTKGGTSADLAFPADFVSSIGAIPTGGGGVNVQTATGTFTGNGTNTQSFVVPFEPDLIYIYSKMNDTNAQRGIIEILIVKDITAIVYTDASDGNKTSTGIYVIPAVEMSGLNGNRTGKPYNQNNGNYGTGAVYSNGSLTITNYNGINFYFYQQEYTYKIIKYTA